MTLPRRPARSIARYAHLIDESAAAVAALVAAQIR
jgi:hypothetical protein